MLRKHARLRAAEVREVLAKGRGKRGEFLSLKLFSASGPFRAAAVVSKKVAKTAVGRNRLRRALYGALRETSLPLSGHAILFVQRIPATPLRPAFKEEIKKLLHV